MRGFCFIRQPFSLLPLSKDNRQKFMPYKNLSPQEKGAIRQRWKKI
jgi:hypothetical protein